MPRRAKPQVYWREGGEGPALVLLNGWSASGLAWPRAWVRELEQTFRVIRIDNRGSGFSRFAETPFTIQDLADDVVEVLDDLELQRATVLGLSMGGMIAQEYAIRHRDRIDGLVVIGSRPPAPAFDAPPESSLMLELLGPPRKGETLTTYFTRLWTKSTGPGFAEREPELIAELVEQIVARPTSRQALMVQLRAVGGWGHADRLSQITAPTVVIQGDQDPMAPVENGKKIAELIPGARYLELPGIGHLPPIEAPRVVLEQILDVASRAQAIKSAPASTQSGTPVM
jgi:pimeloyl-ACP methyl ester carboxylesterase